MATQIKKQAFREYKVKYDDDRIIPLHLLHWKVKDISGERFGKLTTLGVVQTPSSFANKGGNSYWLCQCECAQTTLVQGHNLRKKNPIKSCGCIMEGVTSHKLYPIWKSMNERCNNKNYCAYPDYGGRGIRVCVRWMTQEYSGDGFKNFLEDMQDSYSPGLYLDRRNNEDGYCPDNCRWVTPKESSRNTRRNVRVEINGETKCVSEWVELTGLSRIKINQLKQHAEHLQVNISR